AEFISETDCLAGVAGAVLYLRSALSALDVGSGAGRARLRGRRQSRRECEFRSEESARLQLSTTHRAGWQLCRALRQDPSRALWRVCSISELAGLCAVADARHW